MKTLAPRLFVLGSLLVLSGCVCPPPHSSRPTPALQAGPSALSSVRALPVETRRKILALDPEHVTQGDVLDFLSQLAAPRIICIHGGLLPINSSMNSFARFLVALGYPEASLRNQATGEYAYGHYSHPDVIAGTIAWYYEEDGLRPMMVGHSLGGIQVLRVLHLLAGESAKPLMVWNPCTGKAEKRSDITDPLTGSRRPLVGLQLSYASAANAGGVASVLPGQWDTRSKLRQVPDSVQEFTGFQKGFDLVGGDYLGYTSGNDYHPTGGALVRNVRLPALCPHSNLPYVNGLLKNREFKDWITEYRPSADTANADASNRKFGLKAARILWAAEVWYSIKKNWVLELQRLTRASFPRDCDP